MEVSLSNFAAPKYVGTFFARATLGKGKVYYFGPPSSITEHENFFQKTEVLRTNLVKSIFGYEVYLF